MPAAPRRRTDPGPGTGRSGEGRESRPRAAVQLDEAQHRVDQPKMLAMDAKLARSALAVLAALALCACAQLPWSKPRMQVQTQYDRRADFARRPARG